MVSEQDWRAQADAKGISKEHQDAYIQSRGLTFAEQPTQQLHKKVNSPDFNEPEFRRIATEKGIPEEQQTAYVNKQKKDITIAPELFATPDINRTWMVKPSLRSLYEKGTIPEVDPEDHFKLDDENIVRIAEAIGADPGTKDGINAIYKHAEREENWRLDKKDLLSSLQEYNNIEQPYKWLKSNFNSAAASEWKSIQARNKESIAELAKERGLELYDIEGEFYAKDAQGELQRVTPSLLDSLGKSKFEALGGIAGGFAGAATAARLPVNHPYAKAATIAAGGILGTVVGEEVDYLASAIQLQEQLSAKVAIEKAIGSAQANTLFSVAGAGVALAGKAAWSQIKHAYNFVRDGNTQGAYTALKDTLGYLSDEEVEDIVSQWEKLRGAGLDGVSDKQKAIEVLPKLAPGGEAITSAASRYNSKVAVTVRSELNNRATDLLDAAKNPADDTGAQLQKALNNYTNEVKTSYNIVKNQASDIVAESVPGYQFDLPLTALQPALEETIDKIADPTVVTKLQRLLVRIDQLTDSRTFDDLLELREILNEFRYASRVTNKSKFVAREAVEASKNSVDKEIDRVMEMTEGGKQWVQDWKGVNKAYGEYKMLTQNALYKLINKEGAGERDIAKALIKYGDSIDNTYDDVVSKLPIATRASVENEIVSQLATKHTIGKGESFKAISFPELANELKYYNFNSAKAIKLKEAVNRLAEVYRNDRELFGLAGELKESAGQTIATTITGKIKMATINRVWSLMNQLKPGAKADVSSLVDKSARLLENPLDKDIVEKVLKDVGDDFELEAAIKRLQVAVAKDAAEGKTTARIPLFRDHKTGKLYAQDGIGRAKLTDSVPAHRVLRGQKVFEILGRHVEKASDLTKTERSMLIDKGYIMTLLDNGSLIDLR